tara:strand:+ start:174 stop:350 length:177 start_codon:yes stop_codon:yes gene_type:complete
MDNELDVEYWNIIESNFGIVDAMDEEETNLFDPFRNQAFTIINPAPGIIIMIKDEYYG